MNKEGKKLKKPTFKLRTGIRSVRRKSIEKWSKWRVPQGIDISWKRGDGNRPKIGYQGKKEWRGLHPKGKPEIMINNLNDIINFKGNIKDFVFRFSSAIGKKKKQQLLKETNKRGMYVVNA